MNIQRIIVASLLRVYPARWRAEYGAELTHVLLSRPLSLRVTVDVVWSGLWQRARTADAATFAGLATMLLILAGLVSNTVLLQDSSITLPRVVVKPFRSDLFALLLIVFGFGIQLRRGGNASESGKAAARVSFLSGLPIMAAGLLALTGLLDLTALGYHSGARHPFPSALDVFVAPLFALPQSYLFGTMGGGLGRLMRKARNVTFAIVLIASVASVAFAQQAAPVMFEVASVKPNKSGQRGGNLRGEPGGRVNATNMPLQSLVTFAFQVPPYLLAGAPPWIADERFDIVAKLEGNPSPPAPGSGPGPLNLAMQNLLADRFKLKFHRETREADMYALVMARPGGSPGPGLIPSKQDCSPQGVEARRASPPPGVFCGMQMGPGRIGLGGFPLSTFVNGLAAQVGRVVVDRTGLTGNWDFELKFIPEQPIGLPPGAELPPPDPNAASVFTALQEQLGLRLQATRGLVEFFVIDSVERPIAD